MWSGAPQWASWALQPKNFQNLSHEEVDWAELAKQWIQMKESVDTPPPPPPPLPQEGLLGPNSNSNVSEEGNHTGGEMDMEIEDDKEICGESTQEEETLPSQHQPQQQEQTVNGDMWQSWWDGTHSDQGSSNWGWGWSLDTAQSDVSSTQPPGTAAVDIPSQVPVLSSQFAGKSVDDYVWTPDTVESQQPSRIDYSHRAHRSRSNFSTGSHASDKPPDFQLDASQRKKLPLWIREGLEKMEREKQRKLEKERELLNKEELLRKKKEVEKHARQILKEDLLSHEEPQLPPKSKFESDSELSDEVAVTPSVPEAERREVSGSPVARKGTLESSSQSTKIGVETSSSHLSQEEKMEVLMRKLRRWMTEILLEVTSAMMEEIASEVIQKARKRGLSIYSDSDEDEESEKEVLTSSRNVASDSEEDSDTNLRETIERKKRAFKATEKIILQKLQRQEEENRRKFENEPQEEDVGEEEVEEEEHEDKEKNEEIQSSPPASNLSDKNSQRSSTTDSSSNTGEEFGKDEEEFDRRNLSSSSSDKSQSVEDFEENETIRRKGKVTTEKLSSVKRLQSRSRESDNFRRRSSPPRSRITKNRSRSNDRRLRRTRSRERRSKSSDLRSRRSRTRERSESSGSRSKLFRSRERRVSRSRSKYSKRRHSKSSEKRPSSSSSRRSKSRERRKVSRSDRRRSRSRKWSRRTRGRSKSHHSSERRRRRRRRRREEKRKKRVSSSSSSESVRRRRSSGESRSSSS